MEKNSCTVGQLEIMRSVDIRTVDPSTLRDIRDVIINTELPKEERMLAYIRSKYRT